MTMHLSHNPVTMHNNFSYVIHLLLLNKLYGTGSMHIIEAIVTEPTFAKGSLY